MTLGELMRQVAVARGLPQSRDLFARASAQINERYHNVLNQELSPQQEQELRRKFLEQFDTIIDRIRSELGEERFNAVTQSFSEDN